MHFVEPKKTCSNYHLPTLPKQKCRGFSQNDSNSQRLFNSFRLGNHLLKSKDTSIEHDVIKSAVFETNRPWKPNIPGSLKTSPEDELTGTNRSSSENYPIIRIDEKIRILSKDDDVPIFEQSAAEHKLEHTIPRSTTDQRSPIPRTWE